MTGSLQTKNGKYYAVINLVDNNGKRKQKWLSTGYDVRGNKKKAEKFLRDKICEYETTNKPFLVDILFSDYVLKWLELKKICVEEVTYQGYSTIVNVHIVPYFKKSGLKLSELRRQDIQSYIEHKSENGRSDGKGGLPAKTIKSHIVIIKQVCKEAIKDGLISNNPSEYLMLPKIQRYEAQFYNVEELKTLFKAIKDEPLFPLIYFTAVFGLRRSEVLGLKWDSVDFDNNRLYIKHTVVRFSTIVEKDCTKNEASRRSYPLGDIPKSMLLELKEKENRNRKLCGKDYIDNDYIFKWDNGEPYKPEYISHIFQTMLEKNGLRKIRFHDLRHSCASLLVALDYQIKDIQEWLGHADINTTANIYSHLDTRRKNNIANSMSNTFNI